MNSGIVFGATVSLLLLYLLAVEKRRVGATSLTLAGLVALYGLGFWYFSYDAPHLVPSIVERTHYVFTLGFVSLLAGIESVRLALAGDLVRHRRRQETWQCIPLTRGAGLDHWLLIVALAVAVFVLATMLRTGRFSMLTSFFSLASEQARADLRQNAASGGYLYALLITSFGPFLSAVVLLRALSSRNRLMLLASALLCSAIFLARFATLTKSMWVVYLAQIVLTLYVVKSIELPLGRALIGVAGLVGVLFVGSWLAFPEAPAGEIAQYLLYRIVQITNEVTYQTLYTYPDYIAHSGGLNVGLLAAMAGHDVPAPAHTAVAAFFGSGGATFNSMFMGGAWVDFGWAGVAVVSYLVGVCIRLYDYFALSLGKSAVGCALIGFAVVPADQLLATSAQTAMLTGGLVSIPLMIMCLMPLVRRVPVEGQRFVEVRGESHV